MHTWNGHGKVEKPGSWLFNGKVRPWDKRIQTKNMKFFQKNVASWNNLALGHIFCTEIKILNSGSNDLGYCSVCTLF